MPPMVGVVFALALTCFLVIQIRTRLFERSYPLAVLALGLLLALAFWFTVAAVRVPRAGVRELLVLLGVLFTAVNGLLFALKLRKRDTWTQSASQLLRTSTKLDFPHDEFLLTTEDGVTIKINHIHLLPDKELRSSVVILAHGGLRSKDLFIKALMSAWLAETFDVVTFDFRGHGESSGYWTGDGKSVADLKAVVNFVKEKRYRKVGVYGRSMGGWTAVLQAAEYHNTGHRDVDAIVIAGMPPGYYTEVPEFRGRLQYLRYPGAALLVRIVTGMRTKPFPNVRSAIAEIHKVAPIPLLILYNEVDPGAGVAGIEGAWESMSPSARPSDYRHISELPYTAREVYERAREPKHLVLLPGVAHVYSLVAMRTLFLEIEKWFTCYLGDSEPIPHVELQESI